MTTFDLHCYHNEYLAEGQQEINAIITITSSGATGEAPAAAAPAGPPAEVIIVDVSGSMDGTKIREARKATAAAIDCIRDGAHFSAASPGMSSV